MTNKAGCLSNQIERICISVNMQCNYACKYCYFFNRDGNTLSKSCLNEAEIYSILERCFDYHRNNKISKIIKVNFVGSGEPLINWKEISAAVATFWENHPEQDNISFYIVTNASLVTREIANEMKLLKITPSVSLDGPKEIHDSNRILRDGKGTFEITMKGISILQDTGFDVAINSTLSKKLEENLGLFFDFVIEHSFTKVIFDRMVDVPAEVDSISYNEFYIFLEKVDDYLEKHNIKNIEIGNLEAYSRNIAGVPDRVCTMFGGSCGAGTNFLIYMGTDVYPCGRMFGDDYWLLGTISDEIESISKNMLNKIPQRTDCSSCKVHNYCIRDCIFDYFNESYRCDSRKEFIANFSNK
ncbi:radical SAM protein [Methanolobus sediminis]|uniref:Radical SAM protein n=1 Tax=Methanolobus sediminis TaxID=3072978 RepID=A0AA51ULA6_9EURY|nr:radical SAM protein [Methanolobus sediminis]WMW25671.1 radical SAM protein [Methanolobus sediminis]